MSVVKKGAKRASAPESMDMVNTIYRALMEKCGVVGDLWLMGVETSARGCDLRDLAWDDIDFRSQYLRIKQKKTGGVVEIEITDTARALLEKRHAAKGDQEYVFQVDSNRSKGKPVSRSKVTATLKEVCDLLKYRGEVPHDMVISMHSSRKALAAEAFRNGVEIEVISVMLGHKSSQHTLRYLGITDDRVNSVRRSFSSGITVA